MSVKACDKCGAGMNDGERVFPGIDEKPIAIWICSQCGTIEEKNSGKPRKDFSGKSPT